MRGDDHLTTHGHPAQGDTPPALGLSTLKTRQRIAVLLRRLAQILWSVDGMPGYFFSSSEGNEVMVPSHVSTFLESWASSGNHVAVTFLTSV